MRPREEVRLEYNLGFGGGMGGETLHGEGEEGEVFDCAVRDAALDWNAIITDAAFIVMHFQCNALRIPPRHGTRLPSGCLQRDFSIWLAVC